MLTYANKRKWSCLLFSHIIYNEKIDSFLFFISKSSEKYSAKFSHISTNRMEGHGIERLN